MPTAAIAKTSTPDAAAGNPVDVVTLNPGAGTADRQVVTIGDPTTGTNYVAVNAAGEASIIDSRITDGTQKAIARGAAKGVTTAGDATTTAASADRQPLDVTIYTAAGVAKDPTAIRALTSADVVTAAQGAAAAAASAWPHKLVDSGGVNVATVKAASTAIAATDLPLAVGLHPTSPLPVGANVIGALTANQSVNVAQIAAAATVTAAAGVQKVGVVGNAGAIFDAATGAAVPANGLFVGGRAATANPANATGGNLVGLLADHAGRLVTTLGQMRELVGIQQTNVAATGETTIVTAGGAGVFNDLIFLIITTAGLAAQTITIKDATAGTTRFVLNYPNAAIAPGSPLVLSPGFAIPQAAANANWTVTQTLTTACNYTAVFLKNT